MGRASLRFRRGVHRLRRGVSDVFFLVNRHVVLVHLHCAEVTGRGDVCLLLYLRTAIRPGVDDYKVAVVAAAWASVVYFPMRKHTRG